jgi:hypothetical protein
MENIVFTSKKLHVFGLFIPKKHNLGEKKISVSHAAVVAQNLYRRYLSRRKSYRFEFSATFHYMGWIDAPHTQNFEILKSLEKTQESKKFEIIFDIFA